MEQNNKMEKNIKIYHPPPELEPKLIIIISGKRKCGKDFITNLLKER